MAKNKVFLTVLLALVAGCAVLIGCAREGDDASESADNSKSVSDDPQGILELKPQFPTRQAPEEFPFLAPLNPEIETQIIADYRRYLGDEKGLFEVDAWIDLYCGTYNGYVAALMGGGFVIDKRFGPVHDNGWFSYANTNYPIVWKEGQVYEMSDARYRLGLPTDEDMKSIARYVDAKFIPTEKRPALEFLSPEIEKQILEDERDRTDSVHWPVWMGGYFGTYNGCVVVAMGETGLSPLPPTTVKIIIAGTLFEIPNRFFPSAWKEGQFYGLESAYELGLLTREDIRSIAYYYWHGLYIGYDYPTGM